MFTKLAYVGNRNRLGEPAAMSAPSDPLFATFIAMLINTLAAMVPGNDDDSKETRRGIAQLMFEAYQPRDAIEAMAAARAVAAHHAAMDNFSRAAQPGISDATVVRLRANALAAGRSVEAMLRARDKRREQQATASAQAPAQPPAVNRETPCQPVVRQESPGPSQPPADPDSNAPGSMRRPELIMAQSSQQPAPARAPAHDEPGKSARA
jgi:hypothetical protein